MLRLINAAKRSEGLSLVEVIIAIAIGLIGTLGSYGLLMGIHGTNAESRELLQAQQDARNIMERITRELRESSPEVIWPHYMDDEESDYIAFFTPRNGNNEFIVNNEVEPVWQRGIAYWLDDQSCTLYRYQLYLINDPNINVDYFAFEEVSKNVENITFRRANDMITVNIRTFADSSGGVGQVARSHADITTTIKLRN